MELPQTPPCGPQFGVRRVNLFRVGGEEALGPGGSRGGAERGAPPHPPRVGLRPLSVCSLFVSASGCPSFSLSAPALGVRSRLLSLARCCPCCSFGYPRQLGCYVGAARGDPRSVYYAPGTSLEPWGVCSLFS